MQENRIRRDGLDLVSIWRIVVPWFTTPVLVCAILFLTGYRSIGLVLVWMFSGTIGLAIGVAWHMLSPERRQEIPPRFVIGLVVMIILMCMLCVSFWFDEEFWTWPVPWSAE